MLEEATRRRGLWFEEGCGYAHRVDGRVEDFDQDLAVGWFGDFDAVEDL